MNSAAKLPGEANIGSNKELDITAQLCLRLSKLFTNTPLRSLGFKTETINERFESYDNYLADRVSNVENYYTLFSKICSFEGQRVLDIGCNKGYLLDSFLKLAKFEAIGADINPQVLALGRKAYGDRINFVQTTPQSIPLESNSIDIIYTIDTVEHLSRPKDIFLEAYRIVKPGGLFLVHFGPWLNPYGSHLEDIIPFPWPHAIFSMDTLLKVAAATYDSPDYQPACYWFDPETGVRQANPYINEEKWREFLNHLTIGKFKRLVQQLPFEQIHYEQLGFGGKRFSAGSMLKMFANVPVLREFFTSNIFCVLKKPIT